MLFTWQYQGTAPRKLRSVFKSFGVTSSLMKVAIFHGGAMYIDGENAWAVDQVQPGQTVSLELPNEKENSHIEPYAGNFDIAYEDDDFLVINKAAGVATVPAHNVSVKDSLVNRVKYYYLQHQYPNLVTHVATRLDKNTSGLVIFPKHRFAHAVLDRQLKKRQVHKEYLAIVSGQLPVKHGYVFAPIQRDPTSFVQREVNAQGKPSITEYWVEQAGRNASLVRINLHTGRTHQIRVHFQYLGHPLWGDDMYGGPQKLIQRQALHCRQVSFYSPFKERWIVCRADLPIDMRNVLEILKLK